MCSSTPSVSAMEGSVYSVVDESDVGAGSRPTNGSNGSRDIGGSGGSGVGVLSGPVAVGSVAARVGECLEFDAPGEGDADCDVEGDGDVEGSPDTGCSLRASAERTVLVGAAGVGLSPHPRAHAIHGARGRSPFAGACVVDSEVTPNNIRVGHSGRTFVSCRSETQFLKHSPLTTYSISS